MSYNFVIFGLFPWNSSSGNNIKDMSLELSRHHRVLYVDVPLKRKERWFRKNEAAVIDVIERQRSGRLLKKIGENLWHYVPEQVLESVNSLTSNFLFDRLNKINNQRMAKALRRAVQEVGFPNYILINDNDIYNGVLLKGELNPPAYIYYLRDNLSAFSYWKRHASRLEPELIRNSDLVVTNSEYLSSYARKYNPNSYYIGQGCDVTHYLQKPTQVEINLALKDIPKPVIGYIGALNSERLNMELMLKIAVNMPDLSLVLIGPEDQIFKASKLHGEKNVYFLGTKPYEELPKYVHGFDVAINPQLSNEITLGNYPRKVDEYLAAGVPVVATKTQAMWSFREHVDLAETEQEYCSLIKLAISENCEIKIHARKKFACTHTWENSVSELLLNLEKLQVKRSADYDA